MADEVKAVEFVAEIRQVKTMADHTVNVTLNLPEYCIEQAAWFMQHQGEMVRIVSGVEVDRESRKVNESQSGEPNY